MEASEPKYASFWLRLLAFIIDYLLINFILGFVIALIVIIGFGDEGPEMVQRGDELVRDISESWGPAPFVLTAVYWLYFALMHSSAWGATVGKRVLSLYVVDQEGQRLTFIQATIRFFGKILSTLTFFVGFIIALFHPQGQALHDLIAKTYVMRW